MSMGGIVGGDEGVLMWEERVGEGGWVSGRGGGE